MPILNPTNSWLALDARCRAEQFASISQLLKAVRDHVEYEVTGQLDALMGTLTADPVYHFRGTAAPMVLKGRATVEGFYRQMIAAGGNQFEIVIDRIVADAGSVITEGQVKQVHTGAELTAMGRSEVAGAPIERADLFLTVTQLITVWPNDGAGLLVGEDIYFGEAPQTNIRRIDRTDLPRGYRWEHRV